MPKANKQEAYVGEISVVAGFLLRTENHDVVAAALDSLFAQAQSPGKKHITDLSKGDQEKMRREVYKVLRSEGGVCLYEAAYTQGAHKLDSEIRENLEKAKQVAKSADRSGVAVASRWKSEPIQPILFQGVFGKAIAFGSDSIGPAFHLHVTIDPVDNSTIELMKSQAADLIGPLEFIETVKGYHIGSKQERVGRIKVEIHSEAARSSDFDGVTFFIDQRRDGLTLAADVLANSIRHHLESGGENQNSLNGRSSIQGHPLEDLFWGLTDSGFPDLLFRRS